MHEPKVQNLEVSLFRVPTQSPESDGTLKWDSTTLVIVEIQAGNHSGLGYTYADRAAAELIKEKLSDCVIGQSAFDIPELWLKMYQNVRNLGRAGVCSMAISAVDTALWDLKAKLLGLPLATLFGKLRSAIPLYGSGGFTSYDQEQLENQLSGWVDQGISRVKMKIGRDPEQDPERVRIARKAIGPSTELFVDANGAYSVKQALTLGEKFADVGVSWFEEPVSSDDLDGLHLLRQRMPTPIEIAAGEYGYNPQYFRRMLETQAVDVLQADATRCGGYTGYLRAAALCDAFQIPLSAHCAPSLHLHANCAAPRFRHQEYFFDHVEIERRLFDGFSEPVQGMLHPDLSRPGCGLELKKKDAARFAA